MATVYDKKVCALALGPVLGMALALSACASTAPRVPPPPGYAAGPVVAAAPMSVATPGRPPPPRLKRISYPPGAEPVLSAGPAPAPAPVVVQAPAPAPALVRLPTAQSAPLVASAPAPASLPPVERWQPSTSVASTSMASSPAYSPVGPSANPSAYQAALQAAAPASDWPAPAAPDYGAADQPDIAPPAVAAYSAPLYSPALAPAAPVAASPAPLTRSGASAGGFVIGPGDTVQIDVLGRPELTARGNVAADGRVTVALVGAVNIGGLTPVQAADRIAAAYQQGQYLVSPQVTVTLADFQSQTLTVLGEVRSPGRFAMRTRLSVLDGLALAGGITEQGASTAYLLRPEQGVVSRYEIDLEALIQAGAGQQYFEALAGDTLVVPRTSVFYIYGEAKNPNSYKLKPGMTVIQALSLAGGLTDKGSDKRIDIRRRDVTGQLQTLAVSLNEPLQADDVVYVRERLF